MNSSQFVLHVVEPELMLVAQHFLESVCWFVWPKQSYNHSLRTGTRTGSQADP